MDYTATIAGRRHDVRNRSLSLFKSPSEPQPPHGASDQGAVPRIGIGLEEVFLAGGKRSWQAFCVRRGLVAPKEADFPRPTTATFVQSTPGVSYAAVLK